VDGKGPLPFLAKPVVARFCGRVLARRLSRVGKACHGFCTVAIHKSDQGLGTRGSHVIFVDIGGRVHMPSKPLDEEFFLERAREAYAQSERMVHPEARRLMREVAMGYQRLAQTAHALKAKVKLAAH
jgi:hypothetical protein